MIKLVRIQILSSIFCVCHIFNDLLGVTPPGHIMTKFSEKKCVASLQYDLIFLSKAHFNQTTPSRGKTSAKIAKQYKTNKQFMSVMYCAVLYYHCTYIHQSTNCGTGPTLQLVRQTAGDVVSTRFFGRLAQWPQ